MSEHFNVLLVDDQVARFRGCKLNFGTGREWSFDILPK